MTFVLIGKERKIITIKLVSGVHFVASSFLMLIKGTKCLHHFEGFEAIFLVTQFQVFRSSIINCNSILRELGAMNDVLKGGLGLWLSFHKNMVMPNYSSEEYYLTKVEKILGIIK